MEKNLDNCRTQSRKIKSGNFDMAIPMLKSKPKELFNGSIQLESLSDLYTEQQCIFTSLLITHCECGIHIHQ